MQYSYFDHNATTPVAPEVLAAHASALAEVYGNASSIHHYGQQAKQAFETARRRVAARIGATPREIVFTSGGTESDNLAILGVVRAAQRPGPPHVVTSAIEHPAVLNTCAWLEREGVEISYVPVGPSGIVDPDDVRRALRPRTVLVTIMHANNELGALQPVREIARIVHHAGALLHSDGVQVPGRLPVDVNDLGVDLYTLGGHKMNAPKGIGALFVRDHTRIAALAHGGHHERERRPGTENVPGAVAFGAAAGCPPLAQSALRDRLELGILAQVDGAHVNGSTAHRLPNTANIRFDGVEGEPLVISLDLKGFAVSSGAACSSGAVEPSHVLTAIGLSRADARSSLRFSLGLGNTAEQVDALIEATAQSVAHLRRIAPRKARIHA